MSNTATWQETMHDYEAHIRNEVYKATWGHVAPEKNKTYRSTIMFCVSAYCSGTRTLINDGLPNSPWMFDAIHDFINKEKDLEVGVYVINTTFRNFRFWGKPIKIL